MFLQIWVLGFRGLGLGTRFHGFIVKGICVGGAKSAEEIGFGCVQDVRRCCSYHWTSKQAENLHEMSVLSSLWSSDMGFL